MTILKGYLFAIYTLNSSNNNRSRKIGWTTKLLKDDTAISFWELIKYNDLAKLPDFRSLEYHSKTHEENSNSAVIVVKIKQGNPTAKGHRNILCYVSNDIIQRQGSCMTHICIPLIKRKRF